MLCSVVEIRLDSAVMTDINRRIYPITQCLNVPSSRLVQKEEIIKNSSTKIPVKFLCYLQNRGLETVASNHVEPRKCTCPYDC